MNNNVMQVPKICEECGKEYLPTSNRQRYCPACGPATKHRNHIERCRNYHYSHYNYRGYNQAGSNNNRHKAGLGSGRVYSEYAKYRESNCAVCKCTGMGTRLVVHHRDGNYTNNIPSNLITLCDSCHKMVHSGKITLEKV